MDIDLSLYYTRIDVVTLYDLKITSKQLYNIINKIFTSNIRFYKQYGPVNPFDPQPNVICQSGHFLILSINVQDRLPCTPSSQIKKMVCVDCKKTFLYDLPDRYIAYTSICPHPNGNHQYNIDEYDANYCVDCDTTTYEYEYEYDTIKFISVPYYLDFRDFIHCYDCTCRDSYTCSQCHKIVHKFSYSNVCFDCDCDCDCDQETTQFDPSDKQCCTCWRIATEEYNGDFYCGQCI